MSTNDTIYARGTDAAGNTSTEGTLVVSNIDKIAPITPTIVADNINNTNMDVTVTITFDTDVATKEFKLGSGGSWNNYMFPVSLSSNNTIYARGTDAAGNVSEEGSLVVSNINKVAPVITIGAYNTDPTNQDVTITVTTDKGTLTAESHTFTENGSFGFAATDEYGNTATETVTISHIDKVAPTTPTLAASSTDPTNTDITVTITFSGDSVEKQYKVGATGSWTAYVAPVVVSNNDIIYARSMDEAGNMSAVSSIEITNINKVAPVITIGTYNTDPTNQNVTITATTDKGTLNTESHTFTENDSFSFTSTDEYGNTATEIVTITHIDKVSPVITIAPYNTAITSSDILVSATTNEGTLNQSSNLFTENGNFEFVATDAAGNVSTETVIIINIFKNPPVVTVSAGVVDTTNKTITFVATTTTGTLNENSHVFTTDGTFTFVATDENELTASVTITVSNFAELVFAETYTAASAAVATATVVKTQITVNNGWNAVFLLPDGDQKTSFRATLRPLDLALKTAVTYVITAESSNLNRTAIINAELKVNIVVDAVPDKAGLAARVLALKTAYNQAVALAEYNTNLKRATYYVVKAEASATATYITNAITYISKLPADDTARIALEVRLNVPSIKLATASVIKAEKYKTATYIATAQKQINYIYDCDEKTALQVRLDAINN